MPISGTIPITDDQSLIPSSSFFLLGEDGNHYVVVGKTVLGGAVGFIKLGCCETNSTVWTRNTTEWVADFDSLGLTTAAGSLLGTGNGRSPIPIDGTAYFYIPGTADDGTDGYNCALRYKIESSSSIVVDGAVCYKTNSSATGNISTFQNFGSTVVGSDVFAVANLFNGIFDAQPGTYLVRLPTSIGASIVEENASVWPTMRTYLGTALGDSLGTPQYGHSIAYSTWIALKAPDADTVWLVSYRNSDSLPGGGSNLTTAGSEKLSVNYSTQTVGSLESLQSALDQPWSDVGLGYGGAPTLNNEYNDYSIAHVTALGSGVYELLFGRIFYDAPTVQAFRRFNYNETTGAFSAVGSGRIEATITDAGANTSDRAVLGAREGDNILMGRYDTGTWRLGEFSLPITEDVEDECGAEDEADALADTIDWPKCELIPRAINVELVTQTVSPGRSFTGIEQIVHADPGYWRITYRDVRVRTRAHTLAWRETESALNGRTGVVLVSPYETPLSAESIVVAADDVYEIGTTRIRLAQTAGEDIRPGMHFSVNGWMYRIARIVEQASATVTVSIAPPLRQAIGTESDLEFNDPVCRCRLERDDGMDINLELLRFANPTVTFVEDV